MILLWAYVPLAIILSGVISFAAPLLAMVLICLLYSSMIAVASGFQPVNRWVTFALMKIPMEI